MREAGRKGRAASLHVGFCRHVSSERDGGAFFFRRRRGNVNLPDLVDRRLLTHHLIGEAVGVLLVYQPVGFPMSGKPVLSTSFSFPRSAAMVAPVIFLAWFSISMEATTSVIKETRAMGSDCYRNLASRRVVPAFERYFLDIAIFARDLCC